MAEKALEGRKALLAEADLSDADETFVEAVLNAASDEKAASLIALIKKGPTAKSSEQSEETKKTDGPVAYEKLEATLFDYK